MTNLDFVPETLEWCKKHYVPPVQKYINCEDFGYPDGMNGSCHWCLEMCPYQWEMCQDESRIRGYFSPISRKPAKTMEEAIKLLEIYKQSLFIDSE